MFLFTRALYAGHMEAAMILVNNNADVNAKDDQDLTPLLLAVINNKVKFLPVLLKLGASPSAQDINLKNSMHYATENGNIEAARLLLEAKKSIQHDVDAENQTPIHYATKLGYDNVKQQQIYMTPFFICLKENVNCFPISSRLTNKGIVWEISLYVLASFN